MGKGQPSRHGWVHVDAITHALLGMVLGTTAARLLGRPARWGLVAGAAALAPDLDAFISPLARIDALYWMGHRSASHSIFIAPLAGWGFVHLLGRFGHRFPNLKKFRWQRGDWIPILIGAWSHVPLDLITHKGVPLLWPISDAFVSLELFYWMVPWLAPISLLVFWLRWKERIDDRRVAQAAVVLVAILVVLAGIRISTRPDGEVYATDTAWVWHVAEHHDNGTIAIHIVGGDDDGAVYWYARAVPDAADPAVRLVQESLGYRAFRFDAVGPIQVAATPWRDGWNVTLQAVLADVELQDAPAWLPKERLRDRAERTFFVDADGVA